MRKPMQGMVLVVLVGIASVCGQRAAIAATNLQGIPPGYQYRLAKIPSFDGTLLAANVYTPNSAVYPGKRPTVIMPSSWAMSEWEYCIKALGLANAGYVAVSYAPRGFGGSGGMVDVAGPKSQKDVSSVIDWLAANTMADGNNVGIVGISYGAGLGLLTAGRDPRVKAVVALSGWTDLYQSLNAQETVRALWLNVIIRSGQLAGRLDPEVLVQVHNLKHQTNTAEVMAWSAERSAVSLIDQINERQVPIFIANSYEDNLFPPAQARPFFSQLTGPKKFYLDRGIHGSSAIPGLLGIHNDVWRQGRRWLDQWLAGIDTGILQEEPVTFQTATGPVYFRDFPPLGEAQFPFPLQPINALSTSTDPTAPPHSVISFLAGVDSGATSGVPILSEVGRGVFNLPTRSLLSHIDRRFAAAYQTTKFDRNLKMRGATRVHVPIEPHDGPFQLVAYLYEVDDWGVATLITYGVASRHTSAADVTEIDLELGITSYDLTAGHHLAVALDTIDPLYQAPAVFPYTLAVSHSSSAKVTLDLPLVM